MELRHVRSFIAVAEELNFGRAARRLGLSQPPLSKQIQALEAELGVSLFERAKSGIRLTKAGDGALREAYRLIEQADRLQQAARRAEAGESGQMTIGYLPSAFYEIMPRLLAGFRSQWPDVEVTLKEFSTAGAAQELRNGRIDAAVIRMAQGVEPLQSIILRSERCFVAIPARHTLAKSALIRLEDLEGETLVVPSSQTFPRYYNAILEAFVKANVRPRFAHEALSIASLLAVVGSGIAISLVPRSIQDSLVQGVAFVPLAETIPIVDMRLVWNGNKPSRLVENLIAVAKALPPGD
ncbi:MAG: LysR substrate-binding domain-containing protein [Xanthobacteraceae bacterium]